MSSLTQETNHASHPIFGLVSVERIEPILCYTNFVDDSAYQLGEIHRIAEFLKSLSGHDFSSSLKTDLTKRIVFGDKKIFALMFWVHPKDKSYLNEANWVAIKEGSHVSKDHNLTDLLKQFHIFGEHTVGESEDATLVGDHDSKIELYFEPKPRDYVYLHGKVTSRPLT